MNLFRIFKERRDLRARLHKLDKQNVELADTIEREQHAHEVFAGKVSRAADDMRHTFGLEIWHLNEDVALLKRTISGMIDGEISASDALHTIERIENKSARHGRVAEWVDDIGTHRVHRHVRHVEGKGKTRDFIAPVFDRLDVTDGKGMMWQEPQTEGKGADH